MQQMQFPNIVAFVEGTMEKLFVNRNFHYVRLIPLENGITWTLEALAVRIIKLYRVVDPGSDLVVIWIDREGRTESSDDIASYFRSRLEAEGVAHDKLAIMICDRMTENIILADESLIIEEFGDETYNYNCEGHSGKTVLKQLFKDKGIKYSETLDGVRLLKAMRLSRAALQSESAASFLGQLDLNCWWKE